MNSEEKEEKMIPVTYEINETAVTVNDDVVLSYGIDCIVGGKTVESVKDISTDRSSVEDLAEVCRRLGLEPAHLRDVAEDFIS